MSCASSRTCARSSASTSPIASRCSYAADQRGAEVLGAHGELDRARGAGGALRGERRRRRASLRRGRRRDRVRRRARVSAPPRAVVFDCDGLLIDSEVRWAVAERRVVESHGGAWLPELREQMVGGSGDHTARCIAEWVGLPETAAPDILLEVYEGYLAVLDELGRRADGRCAHRRVGDRRAAADRRGVQHAKRRPCGRRSPRAACRPCSISSSRPIRDAGPSPRRTSISPPARRSASRRPRRWRSRTRAPGAAAARAAGHVRHRRALGRDPRARGRSRARLAARPRSRGARPVSSAARGLRARQAARRARRVRGRAMRSPRASCAPAASP